MRFSWSNTGLFFAVLAAMVAFFQTIWGQGPQEHVLDATGWLLFSGATGVMFMVGAWMADSNPLVGKLLLGLGGLARVGSALFFGQFGEAGVTAAFFDLLPGVLALMAAVMIHRIERRAYP